MLVRHRPLTSLVDAAVAAGRGAGRARAPDTPEVAAQEAIDQKLAVWRFDALGIDPELVARLETLFRMELDRLDAPADADPAREIAASSSGLRYEVKLSAPSAIWLE